MIFIDGKNAKQNIITSYSYQIRVIMKNALN